MANMDLDELRDMKIIASVCWTKNVIVNCSAASFLRGYSNA